MKQERLNLYQIDMKYIRNLHNIDDRVSSVSPQIGKQHRIYVGTVVVCNEHKYLIPLSHPVEKHKKMKNNMDFLKVGNYAVINLNNMFPVPKSQCIYVDISKEPNPSYKALLSAEYRIITSLSDKILKNAKSLYEYKIKNGNSTPLAKRCNDFTLLEEKCKKYLSSDKK